MGLAATLSLVGGAVVDVGPARASVTPVATARDVAVTGSTPTITSPQGDVAPVVGVTLTANPGTWGPAPVTLAYRWYVDGELVSSAGPTFAPRTADIGENVTVKVVGTKDGYDKVSRESEPTRKVVAAPAAVITGATPTISGTPAVGSTLTASAGTWSPAPVTLAYRWSVNGSPVAGTAGEGTTFVPRSADAGYPVVVTVTGSKSGYTSVSRASAATAAVTVPPTATPAPAVIAGPTPTISGTARVGSTLTAVAGTWSPAPVTLAYRWYVDGTAVSGSAGEKVTFVVRSGDVGDQVTVKVTGSKSGSSSVSKTSAKTAAVTAAPASTPTPTPTPTTTPTPKPTTTPTPTPIPTTAPAAVITGATPTISGAPVVGATLTASAGSWSPSPVTLAYRWYVDGVAVSGTSGEKATFVVRSGDVGDTVTVRVTGSKSGFPSVTRESAATSAVTAPAAITGPIPTISGLPAVGSTLTAVPGVWNPGSVTLAYRWYLNGSAVSGADRSTYLVQSADKGKNVTVKVTGSQPGSSSVTKTSEQTRKVTSEAVVGPVPTISGNLAVGSTLSARTGSWSPAPVALEYQWLVDGTAVSTSAGRASTFVIRTEDQGKSFSVVVTGEKSGYASSSMTSASTGPVAPVGLVFSSDVAANGLDEFGTTLGADRAFIVDDPTGEDRSVIEFDVRSTDINNGYPRSQLATDWFLDEGEDYYFGFAVDAPRQTVDIDSPAPGKFNQLMLFEVYGEPFGAGGPNRLYLNDGRYELKAAGSIVWSMAAPADAWVDFAIHYRLSTDGSVGYVALTTNTGSGWQHQSLTGSSKDATTGEYRLPYATLQAGTNDGDANYATIKTSFADSADEDNPSPIDHAVMYFSDLKVGTTRSLVDPRTFQ